MWKKVVAPTVVVSVLWLVATCGTSYMLDQLDANQTRLLNCSRNVIQAAGSMQENLWRLQALLLEAAEHLERGRDLREKFRIEANQIEGAFERSLSRAKDNASTAAELEFVRDIRESFTRYRSMSHERFARKKSSPEEVTEAVDAAMRLALAVAQPCEALSGLSQSMTTDAFQRRDRLRAKVDWARFGFVIFGPALGILLGLRVARGLHHSISEISVTLRCASGDLEQEIGLVEVRPSAGLNGLPALQQQVYDVSARVKQTIEQLQLARREAARAERLAVVGELAAGVAHEVRNPLTSVKLLIQAIARNQPPGATDEQRLQIAQQEIARIEATIQELLDFARPPKLRRVPHDVRETLRRALNLVAGRALQGGVSIHEEMGAKPLVVDGDPDQLHQVFINLFLNAIEAMPAGGLLQICAGMHAAAGRNQLQLTVRDSGTGIPEQVMSRLFEPFVTSKERGIGLGLAISRQIVQEHGGRLTGRNAPTGGAVFVVEAPLASARPSTGVNGSRDISPHSFEGTSETFSVESVEAAGHR